MIRQRQTHFQIDMHTIDVMEAEPSNADRALFVAPLFQAFARSYYWGSEVFPTVVQDLISDLGHLLDHPEIALDGLDHIFQDEEADNGAENFEALCQAAVDNYQYEREEEHEPSTD